MAVKTRDPQYVAEQTKFLREFLGLTQESLALASGLTTRTIEKVESGRHNPEEQTLRSIARATNVNVGYFDKPTPEEVARQKAEAEKALKQTAVVRVGRVRTAADFVSSFGDHSALRIDTRSVVTEGGLAAVAALTDFVTDIADIWEDVSATERLGYAQSVASLCEDLEREGYACFFGRHKEAYSAGKGAPLVIGVGVLFAVPAERAEATSYALVHIDPPWQKVG